jgi:hypothetical protein
MQRKQLFAVGLQDHASCHGRSNPSSLVSSHLESGGPVSYIALESGYAVENEGMSGYACKIAGDSRRHKGNARLFTTSKSTAICS